MFAPYIENNLEFIKNYFSLILNNNNGKFPHSVILYGEDLFAQYLLALNFAKILNCTKTKEFGCQCINCEWITNNQHPAVITVSKNDFKPESDIHHTVISVKQTLEIRNVLASTSEYFRVFILCDSEIKTPTKQEELKIREFKQNGFRLPFEDAENNKYWIPQEINKINFQDTSANSLLKSLEEPPQNTAFIFLTKNLNNMLETIISRSQSFYVPSQRIKNSNINFIFNELKSYPEIDRLEINNIAQKLLSEAEKQNITIENLISLIQEYIKQTALANSNNPKIIQKMLDDIKTLHNTQKQINSYAKPQSALENALYIIYKNWE